MNVDVKKIIKKIYDDLKDHPASSTTLMSGKSGIALFNFIFEENFACENSSFGKDVQKIAEENIAYAQSSLAAGKAGTDWFLTYLYKKEILGKSDIDFFCAKEHKLEEASMLDLERGNYDFLHGAIGIAWHLLFRYDEINKNFFKKFFTELNELVKKSETKNIIPFFDPFKQQIISTEVNLGLAHGIPSILKFSVQCIKQNISVDEATLLSKKIIAYLLKHTNTDKTSSFFASKIIDEKIASEQSRLAWCYGDLSLAYVLLQSSQVLKDERLKDFSMEILFHAAQRKNIGETLVRDACFCHGAAGIAHMFNRLHNFTNENFLKEAAEFWLNETINHAQFQNATGGFKTFSPVENTYIVTNGLLEGAAGIGLSLLSFITNDLSWDYCLMLNE